jgi:hypothetical protein
MSKYEAKLLESKEYLGKSGTKVSIPPMTNWGVLQDGYPVVYVANVHGEPMANLIAKLLNENKKYKIKHV